MKRSGGSVGSRGLVMVLAALVATAGCAWSGELPVHVASAGVSVDGKRVSSDDDGIARALYDSERSVVIRVDGDAAEPQLAVVLDQAGRSGIQTATLELAGVQQALLISQGPLDTRRILSIYIGQYGAAEAWSLERWAPGHVHLGQWRVGDAASERDMQRRLLDSCAAACEVNLHTTLSGLGPRLASWQRVAPPSARAVRLHVLSSVPPVLPGNAIAGRLPPELIQKIVRAQFGAFRVCYEMGLGKNAKLEGKLNVRFVIALDGHVSDVADAGSDLPDPMVRDCVLNAFTTLTFPPPTGGVVTVVYPISLAPG